MLDRERGDPPRSLPEGSEKDIPEKITFTTILTRIFGIKMLSLVPGH